MCLCSAGCICDESPWTSGKELVHLLLHSVPELLTSGLEHLPSN